jgi:hypothetical protein
MEDKMREKSLLLLVGAIVLALTAISWVQDRSSPTPRFFKLDAAAKKITGPAETVAPLLKLDLVSVTVDQPQYWPWEDVHLKVIMPGRPGQDVEISLQKRDATAKELGKSTLNEAGILVKAILSGKNQKLELGEYTVLVRTTDKSLQGTAEFSVVEGALGALSLAYEFRQLTDAKELAKAQGGWFMGNASGAGLRWGNGLNVKNELRLSNQPYSGPVTVKTRCFLPGCNGVEAGPAQTADVKNGLIEVVMNVGGHSGPFEIEIITDRGSVKHMFEASGHVERQMVPLTSGMTFLHRAGLAPYEGTVPVPGRQIYIERDKETKDDPLELAQPFSSADNRIALTVRKTLENARIYVWASKAGGPFAAQEYQNISSRLEAGAKIDVPIAGPYSLIAVGGFLAPKNEFWEGHAIVFTPAALKAAVDAPPQGNPNSTISVDVLTEDMNDRPIAAAGVLEVYDNRVASKSPAQPLTSAIGDSFRNAANALSSWEDRTGIRESVAPSKRANPTAGGVRLMAAAPAPARGGGAQSGELKAPEESAAEGEALRQGEEKVVFCESIKTDGRGRANVKVKLPPQTGRCNIRFVAIKDLDFIAAQKAVDVSKKAYVEAQLPSLLVPGSKITARAYVLNSETKDMTLKISGAGLEAPLTYPIKPGGQEIEFDLTGRIYGRIVFELTDAAAKLRDKRELDIRDIGSQSVTLSTLLVGDNKPVEVKAGETAAVYANAGHLLKGIVQNITTTMYSWFGHAEALSAAASVRAMLLAAIDRGLIDDDGLRQTLRTELDKAVRDLEERFLDKNSGLFSPYPGLATNPLWSAWTARNLNSLINALKKSPRLAKDLSATIQSAEKMVNQVNQALEKLGQSIPELAGYDPDQSNRDVIPVEIDGKVYYKVITDDAVVQWAEKKLLPVLDLPHQQDLSVAYAKAYDTWRFLRAFEHTGLLPYLIQNAKALWLAGEKERAAFDPLFSRIAKGAIASQEPGMIQGPALLGGVYSSPQTMVRFLELLLLMNENEKPGAPIAVTLVRAGKKEVLSLKDKPITVTAGNQAVSLEAPPYTVIRIDQTRALHLRDYTTRKAFFKVQPEKSALAVAEETRLLIELDKDKDPFEYYAVIALPSTVSLRQTEDLLTDYKGQILYGQKASGGAKIQLVTVPFRGARRMVLSLEGAVKGTSRGYVLVRHMNNPDDLATVEIPDIVVR